MARVTALQPERRDRVRIDLDGATWRTLPAGAVVAAGLRVGQELDRPLVRELARALRRSRALDAAGRALARRDRSPAGLDAVLAQRGVAPAQRAEALETLERLGYVDDARFAASRAGSLAARGYGNEAIRFDLEREGAGPEAIEAALAGLEPELARAQAVAVCGADRVKAARRLSAKGFSADVVAAVAGFDEQ